MPTAPRSSLRTERVPSTAPSRAAEDEEAEREAEREAVREAEREAVREAASWAEEVKAAAMAAAEAAATSARSSLASSVASQPQGKVTNDVNEVTTGVTTTTREWFYLDGENQQHGPVDRATLQRLLDESQVLMSTLVFTEGQIDWRCLAEVHGLQLEIDETQIAEVRDLQPVELLP
jgi:hypothetical protein